MAQWLAGCTRSPDPPSRPEIGSAAHGTSTHSTPLPESSIERLSRPHYGAGVAASLIAEAVFILMVAMVSLMRGMDPWMVARMPGSFLLGPAAVQPPGFVADDVLLGLGMHLALGILVGLVYAVLLPRLDVSPVMGGIIAGAILYGLGFWLLPRLFPQWLAPFWLPPTGRFLQAIAHVVYGMAFGYSYRWLEARGGRWGDRTSIGGRARTS